MTPAGTDINTVCKAFLTEARVKALRALLRSDRSEATGLAGSAAAVLLACLPSLGSAAWSKVPILVCGDSLDDAGYLYHCLLYTSPSPRDCS